MSTWRDRADSFIATLEVPAGATLKECRRIFRENGWRFHGGTYWGRKQWGKATRAFLIKRGLMPSPPVESAFNFAPDIIFPFRGQA